MLPLPIAAISNLAYASPIRSSNPNQYHARPTANTVTVIPVSFPANASDVDNATYAISDYTAGDGSFELHTFNTPTLGGGATPTVISSVNLKIRYSTTISSKDDVYRIVYYVGASGPVVLKAWTRDATALSTYVWTSISEPTDTVWSWTDIGNIRVRFETNRVGGSDAGGDLDVYEVWASAVAPDPKVSVFPPSIIDGTKIPGSTVTYKLNVSNVFDLAGIEFKLKWNPNILDITSPWVSGMIASPLTPGNITRGAFFPSAFLWTNSSGINAGEPVNKQWIWISFTLPLGTPFGGGKSGTGVLLNIDFNVTGTGFTDLVLFETNIGDTWAEDIPKTLEDGYFSNPGAPEFPFGLMVEIALGVSIFAIWWKKKRRVTNLKHV